MMFFFFSFYFVSTTEARIDGWGIFVSSHEKTVPDARETLKYGVSPFS
jgi:hypothetical protein